MKTLLVENLAHRGTVVAAGFLFSRALLTETEIRRRVLSLWQSNAKVFRADDAVFLLFAQSIRVDCRRAVALPVVAYDEILATFPLSKADLNTFATDDETLVFLEAGTIRRIAVKNLQAEAIENWFDVSGFETIETETLGETKIKPVVAQKIVEVDLREKLKDRIPPADAEMNEILRVLRQKKAESLNRKIDSIIPNQNYASGNAGFSTFFSSAFDSFKNLFGDKNAAKQFGLNAPPKSSNLSDAARRLLARALFQMRVA